MSNISQEAGHGKITAQVHNNQVVFPVLSYTYPLKLLSPRMQQDGVAVVYMITYGGGLVGGDRIFISINIEQDARLVLLSQVCPLMGPITPIHSRTRVENKHTHFFHTTGIDEGVQSETGSQGRRPLRAQHSKQPSNDDDDDDDYAVSGCVHRRGRCALPATRPGHLLPRRRISPSPDVPPGTRRFCCATRLVHVRPPRARGGMGIYKVL